MFMVFLDISSKIIIIITKASRPQKYSLKNNKRQKNVENEHTSSSLDDIRTRHLQGNICSLFFVWVKTYAKDTKRQSLNKCKIKYV